MRLKPHYTDTVEHKRAQQLRKTASVYEKKLWFALRQASKGTSLAFRRQQPIHPYIADFACMEVKLLIELDGASHDLQQGYDQARDAYLQRQGYAILRISNDEIRNNLPGVVEMIIKQAETMRLQPKRHATGTCACARTSAPPPNLPLEGGGIYRADFPILAQKVHGKPLVYLDNAASAQKPRAVLDAMQRFYENDYANIHRGVHELSQRATGAFEAVRGKVRSFINAAHDNEIVFTRGATESINLVAASWGRTFLKPGDEVLITGLEHHANIVPWQLLREEIGFDLRVVPVTPEGDVRLEDVQKTLSPRTKLVSVAHVSNALGTVLPVQAIAELAHAQNVPVLIDGCQAVSHMPVDVQTLGADFYVFSGHKLYGPTGIGVLYGRHAILEKMPPYQGGGYMIESVGISCTTFREPPYRFEAGTPPIAEVIGLGAAIDYVSAIGMENIAGHEAELLKTATEKLQVLDDLRIIGTAKHKTAIVSFVMEGIHPHDLGTVLDNEGVAIRAGHHCAQPLMETLGLAATVRASFGLYNTADEVGALARAIRKAQEIFG
ncbi:MAG: SufS family cysteine desulfurase [Alphaproteobacteria bacterium]|nr:SufS family cysteine desulfurase [Alphaproteobacteria bacterium]